MTKTIELVRKVRGKEHKTRLTQDCILHIDIIEKLFCRCVRLGIVIDIDDLIDTVRGKA